MASRELARLAALIGEPARAQILTALLGGKALTATELALEADVAPSTASAHLAKLVDGRVLAIEKHGRHRYYRLLDADIASMLEGLLGVAARPVSNRRTGPSDPALRAARVCYDHLAGERGVALYETMCARKLLEGRDNLAISSAGVTALASMGIDVEVLASSQRAVCRPCLDWSERRYHLAGALGAAILDCVLARRWVKRVPDSRALVFTADGDVSLRRVLG